MHKNLLVIDNLNFDLNIFKKHKISHVVALGYDRHQVTDYIGINSLSENKIQVIDLNQYRELAETEVRKYVIETVSTLPRFKSTNTDLSSLLLNKSGIDLWGLLEISEKSPFRGKYVTQLYQLACIKLVKQSSNFDKINYRLLDYNILRILLDGEKNYTAHLNYHLRKIVWNFSELKYFSNIIFTLCKILIINIILSSIIRRGEHPTQSHGVFSFYPSWWLKPYTEENSDRFFSNLVKNDGKFLNYIWLSGNLIQIIKSAKKIRWLGRKTDNVIVQEFFRYRDIKNISGFRDWRRLREFRYRILFSDIPSFMNLDVRPILNQELSRCISSNDLIQSHIIHISMMNTLRLLPPKSLLFRLEFQPIDRSLIYSCKNFTTSVGFYHSSLALCENYLSFWFGKKCLNDNYSSLAPDRVIYSNKFSKKALTREGFPESRLLHCGPLRSSQLMRHKDTKNTVTPKEQSVKTNSVKIFIGMSVNITTNEEMLKNLIMVLDNTNSYTLIIKKHPSLEHLDLNLFRGIKRNINSIILNKDDEYLKILEMCDFSVMAGSTIVFESIYLKTLPIVYESAANYNGVNFQQFRRFCLIARDRSQLLNAIKLVQDNSSEVIVIKDNWPELIENNYGTDVSEVDRLKFVCDLESLIARTIRH